MTFRVEVLVVLLRNQLKEVTEMLILVGLMQGRSEWFGHGGKEGGFGEPLK